MIETWLKSGLNLSRVQMVKIKMGQHSTIAWPGVSYTVSTAVMPGTSSKLGNSFVSLNNEKLRINSFLSKSIGPKDGQ